MGRTEMQKRVLVGLLCLTVAFVVALPLRAEDPQKKVPNIFTPNGDGINDNITLESTESMLFVVYNRDGGEVYRAEGKLIVWDGLNQRGQKIADGIYYYILQDPAHSYENSKGFIYLSTSKDTQAPAGEKGQ